MFIELKKIPDGGMRVERILDMGPAPPDREIEGIGPASVDVYVMEEDTGFLISGRFQTTVTLPCARCLRSFELTLEDGFNSTFRYRPEDFPEEAQVRDEDLDLSYLQPDQETLDLREVILEQVVLSLPMKPLHAQDCKGLCSRCGADKNETTCQCPDNELDPRLEPLARLKASMDKN